MLCSAASRWRSPWAAQSRQRRARELERALELTARAISERKVVERGDAGALVARLLGDREAAPQVVERLARGAVACGERSEQVVRLAERA